MFTKKHFEVIAAVLAELPKTPGLGGEATVTDVRDLLAERFADVFAGGNGRFDRDRFIRACQK